MTQVDSRREIAISAKPSFVLVYGSLRIGGIETLIVRTANYLTKNGFRLLICCGDGGLLSALPAAGNLIIYKDSGELRRKLRAEGASHLYDETDVIIISFDPISAAHALYVELQYMSRQRVTHLSGVFHPRAYFMTGERFDRVLLNYWVARAVGFNCLFFMNEACRISHAKRWGVDLSRSAIVTLPIDVAESSWSAASSAKLRIVSVGRLVDFKAYNLGAAKIAVALRALGVRVTWDIYGYGPLQYEIEKEIERCGAGEFVKLRGELPYRKFKSTVASYDIFVGLGTAALEAAMQGVPTICSTDGYRHLCYGFLSDLPYGNVGELQSHPPEVEVFDLLADFARADQSTRTRISELCRGAAMKYEMAEFVNQLSAIHGTQPAKPGRIQKRFGAWLYWLGTDSAAVRFVRRMMRGYS